MSQLQLKVFNKRQTLPELAQKSLTARCHSAGRDIFGWLASLEAGRDLEKEVKQILRQYLHKNAQRDTEGRGFTLTLDPLAELVQAVHGASFAELDRGLVAL